MNQQTKDLFDDSSMTFGEHLEILRVHLIRAIIGLVIAVAICLLNGTALVDFIRRPIDRALANYSDVAVDDDVASGWQEDWGLDTLSELVFGKPPKTEIDEETGEVVVIDEEEKLAHPDVVKVRVSTAELSKALNRVVPDQFPQTPEPDSTDTEAEPSPTVTLTLQAPEFAQFQATVEQSRRAVTLNVQEAFLTYVKVSLIAGLVLSSPWIFYQLWLFVAAGLYPHERKFVYLYGTMSLGLFLVGAAFCFYAVFPFVLNFLLKFNSTLEISPQIRISEWISFAVMLPLMFGISFQLPLAMLFLERISIFTVEQYREQRRMAILVIAILSMILTPADPMSMLLMMVPLIGLYELGIKLCVWAPSKSPFDAEPSV
ncbi:Sec-independent protein translocase protein TatCy [Thalassoglobus neptunius]|uniref:Sec-independent protein translocase protein TatC n=1 Tax=Thalassoglobus neptunius TaxID=1938619 RepID=A0A5C5X596_9PLAN|nr:twin-arginine translocase subunit TatC [Thalassoglobus neptunius]TWT57395.1 Sec-independent protein translocase protein TatCy [Thalassoglobus neptunius]